ncbi:MAG: VWA domain-containing protein [Proteobacteria bacterium]|nr:VWA domain-containing protein [Pseudomonadota bacterium]
MRLFIYCVLLLALGCQEYEIVDHKKDWGEPRAPLLETQTNTDRVVQTSIPAVDILFVIDNSCSMEDEQMKLAQNFPAFVNYFIDSGLDWHIGVVSTDMERSNHQGKLQSGGGYRYIDESVADPVSAFQSMAKMGINGSSAESGRAAAYTALELRKDGYNAGFSRDDAALSVVVISDEDDYSGNNPISRVEFIDWLRNIKGSPNKVSFSSIVGPPQLCWNAVETGREYIAVTDAVGGIKWSICSQDWAEVLDELGMQASGMEKEFFLTERPVVESIEVRVFDEPYTFTFVYDDGSGEVAPEKGFTYDPIRNSISFVEFVPDELAEVIIDYKILSAAQYNEDTGGIDLGG